MYPVHSSAVHVQIDVLFSVGFDTFYYIQDNKIILFLLLIRNAPTDSVICKSDMTSFKRYSK